MPKAKSLPATRTRLRGWYLRNYQIFPHPEGVTYHAEIFKYDLRAGRISLDRPGAADRVVIEPYMRDAWRDFERYITSQPSYRSSDGTISSGENPASTYLIEMAEADSLLDHERAKRRAVVGVFGYSWVEYNGFIIAEAKQVFFTAPEISTDALSRDLVRYIVQDTDNQEISAFEPVPQRLLKRD